MNQKAVEFVQNQLIRAEKRLKPYVQTTGGFSFPKRYAYFRTEKIIGDFLSQRSEKRWVVMPGISGVGKTTILSQLYGNYRNKFEINHVLFVSLDEASLSGISFQQIIEAYEKILGSSFEELKQPVLILVDEAHRDPQWANVIKVIWGRTKRVFFICTGSSAVLLAPHLEDIGRRIEVEKLYPLSFTEYSMIKRNKFPESGLMQKIKEALYSSIDAKTCFQKLKEIESVIIKRWSIYSKTDIDEYLNIGTLPFALQNNDEASAFLAIDRIIDKLIQKDIMELGDFKMETVKQIKPILLYLAQGSTLSVSKVGGLFGMNKNTLQEILDVLTRAEILIKIPGFKAENKPIKYLFMCPAIRNALLDISGLEGTRQTRRGDVFEDVVAMHLYREFVAQRHGGITHDPAQGGADFILELPDKRIVIEVGSGSKDIVQAQQTVEKSKANFGIVISSDPLQLSSDVRVVKIPHDYFFLI